MCSSLRFLNGQFMEEVRNSMNVKEALGWSGTFMKEGLALYSLLLYEGSGFAKGIKKMQQDSMVALQFTKESYQKGLATDFSQNDLELFENCFAQWKKTVQINDEDKEKIICHMEKVIEKRVDGIMKANRRNYYGECAAFIAALGEIKESRGEKGAKQKIMQHYASEYPRRSAFRAELAAYGWVKR